MEKHKDIQNKNISIETNDNQQLVNHSFCIKKEEEDSNEYQKEEFIDFGYNIDEYKPNISNFGNLNRETNSLIEFDTAIRVERDVLNDCVFETEMEIEIPRFIKEENENTQIIDKTTHIVHKRENLNNLHLNVGEQIHKCEKEYYCKICNIFFHNEYNLKMHISLHSNIKKFKCTACDEQFLELNRLKSHLISHIDNNIKLLENQFLQECNDVGECNSTFCNNITMLDELKTSHSEGGVPIQKRTINEITLDFSVEIENILSTNACGIDPKKHADSYLTVGNAVNSCVPVNREHVNLDESDIANSVGQEEINKDEVYKCAKCSAVFHDRPSIEDHLKPNTDKCMNCCKYIRSPTSCKYPICFQPGTQFYFECDECYNGFYTLKSSEKCAQSAQSEKIKDRPYKCNVCHKTFIHLYHFAAHQRLHKGERPYQCNICDKRFHAKFNLEAHLFSHQNVKRYKCIRRHAGFKPYQCTLCDESFSTSFDFKCHKREHKRKPSYS